MKSRDQRIKDIIRKAEKDVLAVVNEKKAPVIKKEEAVFLINKTGVTLIRNSEGLELKAYQCSAKVWTIGQGTTFYMGKRAVKKGDVITKEEAEKYFIYDVNIRAKKIVRFAEKHGQVFSSNELSALTSFAYNLGMGWITNTRSSTMSKSIKSGNRNKIKEAFSLYVFSNKKKLKGLVTRRRREARLFSK